MRSRSLRFVVILLFLGSAAVARGQSFGAGPAQPAASAPLQSPSEPIGASRCMFCHPAEVEGYARSAMAHSLRPAGQEPDGSVTANGSTITIHSSPQGTWQRWQNGSDESEYRVAYVIGSGNHASGYLVDIGGHLFQSPVAYYKSRQSYDLAPGYENQADPDFTRPIREECVLCHSGRALFVSGTLNQYRSPIFPAQAESITCERCHGPAEKHLADPRPGTIVNPAKLEPAARDSICEQCHLFGAARVANPGKELSDFIPGQPLENTFTTYHDANPTGAFKVISQAEELALSVCARNSGGRLWCGTCHDPHDKPAQPVAYYRSRCLSCHTASFSSSHPSRDSDCVACHMPRRDAKDGGHSAFTDHRIQRRPQTLPDAPSDSGIVAWRQPSPDLQTRNLGIAYIYVGMQRKSSPFIVQGYRDLTKVQQQFADDPDFFKWIGEALLIEKQPSEAAFAFERSLQLDPNSAVAEASAASPYVEEGDATRAIAHLQRAVSLDPLDLPAASTLIGLYRQQGQTAEASELSDKIKSAMGETTGANQTAPQAAARDAGKTAGEVFKNIKVLKDIPADQLIPAMHFITSSLGVECSFCHVEGHFEKDDKKPKLIARDMMQMMFALNKDNFKGHREVTCYSCHRGAKNPVATPIVGANILSAESESNPKSANSEVEKLPPGLPTAAQILANYVNALGGASAIEKIASRVEKGSTDVRGQSVSVEIFTQSPDKQSVVWHLKDGDSATTVDGHEGWSASPGRPPREMHDSDVAAARMDADLQFPLHIQRIFPELRVEYPEKIGDRDAYVLYGIREGQPPVELYFDEQSGLLVRLVRYAESPLGLDPSQVDYADYRDVDGAQVPFRVTLSQPGNTSTTQIDEVRQNVPIDDAIFAKPASDRSSPARPEHPGPAPKHQ
ncbi:MAG: c-type cytochrome [Candidatus Acidiferrales bacterium]